MHSSNEQLAPVPATSISMNSLDGAAYTAPVPSSTSSPSHFSFSNRNRKSIAESLPSIDSDYFNNLTGTAGNDLSGFRMGNMNLLEDPSSSEGFFLRRDKIPTLQEVRALNSTSTLSPTSPFPNPDHEIDEQHADTTSLHQVLSEFQAFCMAIFVTQAEIAGMSSAVAEYLAWLRKVPGLPKVPMDRGSVLETLEARVRELQEMAEEKHWMAWKSMLEKLDGSRGSHLLGDIEAEMRNRTAAVGQEFHTSYDIEKTMQEQISGLLQTGDS